MKVFLNRLLIRLTSAALLLLIFSSCENVSDFLIVKQKAETAEGEKLEPLARVGEQYLYDRDVEGIVAEDVSQADSADIIDRYIESWIKKQLIIDEATEQIQLNEAELERKVLDYRYALIAYEFRKYYVNQQLEKKVTEEEIKAYYEEHQDDFELKQNIIKGYFAKIPKEAPRSDVIRRLFSGLLNDRNKDEIKSYCVSFATQYSLDDSVWLNFDEVIQNTPLINNANRVGLLQNNKFVQSSDETHMYLLRLLDYKIVDQISPLEFVRDDIINIIVNKRKIELTEKLEEQIYEKAERDNAFEIYQVSDP